MVTMRDILHLMIDEGIAVKERLRGCSSEEIELLEQAVGRPLPADYKEFLAMMGHWAGELNTGSDFLYKDVLHLTKSTEKILALDDASDFVLPSNAFVIFMHQGYIFSYLLLNEADQSAPVFSYSTMESTGQPVKLADNFTEYLYNNVKENIEAKKQLRDLRNNPR